MSQGFTPFTPIYAGSANAKSPFDYGSPQHLPSGHTGLSLSQAIALLAAHKQKPSRSFLGDLEHGGKFSLNKVAWTLDKLERPAYAVANAVDKGVAYHHVDLGAAAHGAREGFMGREKTNFGAVLAHHNTILNDHHFTRGVIGLGMDVATDPLTYTGLGVARKAGEEGVAAAAKESLNTGYLAKNASAEHVAAKAAKFDEHAAVLKDAGPTYLHRAVHADKVAQTLHDLSSGTEISPARRAELNSSRAVAEAESKLNDARKLTIRFGSKAHHVEVPIAPLPKGSQKIGNQGIPILSGVSKKLGEAFKPGYNNEILHTQLLNRRHLGERLAGEYFDKIRAIFKDTEKLSPDKQREAMHYFEKPGKYKAVIKGKDGKYLLNPKHIERSRRDGLSEAQLKFVQAMHDTGEYFAAKHRDYGTAFEHMGAKGKLYVPHIVTKSGEGVTDAMLKTNLLTKKGFQKGRILDYSIKELHELHKMGALPHDVETNPFTLMAMHGRSVANQHADQNMINYMTHALGVPSKLVDEGALAASRTAHEAVQAKIAAHPQWDEQGGLNAIQKLTDKHEQLAKDRYAQTLRDNQEAIRHHLEVAPWQQTTQATAARISQRSVDAKDKLAQEIRDIRGHKFKPLLKETSPILKARGENARQLKIYERQATALMKKQGELLKGSVKNPEYNADIMRGVDGITNEYGHTLHFPHEVADAMERLKLVMTGDDKTIADFTNSYRKWLGKWKLAVTSVNPSYGTRNTLSDFWNMYLDGVPMHAMPIYGAKAAKMIRDSKVGAEAIARGEHVTFAQDRAVHTMLDAYDGGALSGQFAGDIQQVTNMLEHANTKLSLVQRGKLIKTFSKMSMDMNRNRENWGRLTHYLYRLDHGDGLSAAAEHVRAAHFDYEDLTPFEQQRMKLVAPFYTWSRKNIPFQLKSLATSPGQMVTFAQAAQEASPGKNGDIVPGYMNDNMYLKFGSKYFNPMIGITDLNNAANPLQLGKSLLSPAIKTPLELYANKNLLTGQPIKDPNGYDRNPVRGGLASALLSLIPGANVGETGRKDKNGKMVHGVGANPYLTYLLGQTPATNLLFDQGSKVRGSTAPENQHRATLAWLTGINGTSVDQKQQQEFALLHFTKDVLPALMKNYRAHGTIPPAAVAKLSPTEKRIAKTLFASLEGRG